MSMISSDMTFAAISSGAFAFSVMFELEAMGLKHESIFVVFYLSILDSLKLKLIYNAGEAHKQPWSLSCIQPPWSEVLPACLPYATAAESARAEKHIPNHQTWNPECT